MTYIAHQTTPLGAITLASDGTNLTGIWFDGQKSDRAGLSGALVGKPDLPIFNRTRQWLDVYFTGRDPSFKPKLAFGGSEFRQAVMDELLAIPFGETTTYGAIARNLARKWGRKTLSAQAVGGAVGHNPISIIVPCHRVVGANGSLTGYAGGLDRKEALLRLEQPTLFAARAESAR